MTEYYQEQPRELPSTLPAGVVACGWRAVSELNLGKTNGNGDALYYRGEWQAPNGKQREAGMFPESVDWSTVPRTPPAPAKWEPLPLPFGHAACAHCGEAHPSYAMYASLSVDGLYCSIACVDRQVEKLAAERRPRHARHCDKCMNPAVGGGLCSGCLQTEDMLAAAKNGTYVHRCAACSEPVASEGAACVPCSEASAIAALTPDPYRAHRMLSEVETSLVCGPPEATSRLTQGIAAARAASAREVMNAPLVKRGKRVEFIPAYPLALEWPASDD